MSDAQNALDQCYGCHSATGRGWCPTHESKLKTLQEDLQECKEEYMYWFGHMGNRYDYIEEMGRLRQKYEFALKRYLETEARYLRLGHPA